MTQDEFLHDHDLDLTVYLINEEMKLRYPESENTTTAPPKEIVRAAEFF